MTESVPAKNRALSAILWGGLSGGTGDLGLAFGLSGCKPRILQSIAAGLIGRTAAYEGGAPPPRCSAWGCITWSPASGACSTGWPRTGSRS